MTDHTTMQPTNIQDMKNTLKPSIHESTTTTDPDTAEAEQAKGAGSEFIVHFVPPAMGTPAAAALRGIVIIILIMLIS